MNNKTGPIFCIGIAGGSGSGKTTLARALIHHFGHENTTLQELDAYYRDLSHLSPEARALVNFDHPDALDWSLFCQHLADLRCGRTIKRPTYDFAHHCRVPRPEVELRAKRFLVTEGILLFAEPEVQAMFNLLVFVDLNADLRFIRRLCRDTQERGRTVESVIHQYLSTVRPMHETWVEPSKAKAHLIVSGNAPVNQSVREILIYLGEEEKH